MVEVVIVLIGGRECSPFFSFVRTKKEDISLPDEALQRSQQLFASSCLQAQGPCETCSNFKMLYVLIFQHDSTLQHIF